MKIGQKSRINYNKLHTSYISLGAMLASTSNYNLVAAARETIENAIKQNTQDGRELKKKIRLTPKDTYIMRSYIIEAREFLEKNNFDLSPKIRGKKLANPIFSTRVSLTGIDIFLKNPGVNKSPEYNAEIPKVGPISVDEREKLTRELEEKIMSNGKVYYSASQIMKMVNITPDYLFKYANTLGPLDKDNNGMPAYSSYKVLDFAKRVLEAEKRKAETETL